MNIRLVGQGAVLLGVMVFVIMFTLMGYAVITLTGSETVLIRHDFTKEKAFYLAEAGIAQLSSNLFSDNTSDIPSTTFGGGSYTVDVDLSTTPPSAIATGSINGQTKRIEVLLSYLARPYEEALYAANTDGKPFDLNLSGKGALGDIINGNVLINGNVSLFEDSQVSPPPAPNLHGLQGDVIATGSVDLYDGSSISGTNQSGASMTPPPDLQSMKYSINNTHDVANIYSTEGNGGERLPNTHALYDVFTQDPSNRSSECASTSGSDYFFEPVNLSHTSPLDLGNDTVYYVDGNVWFHSQKALIFAVSGKATIVATGNIYLCDDLVYANNDSILGLIALGSYNPSGSLVKGGNIYFGDPRWGTLDRVDALMFAGNDFLFNTDSQTDTAVEPGSGFTVNGNMAAANQVSINRDWYTTDSSRKSTAAVQVQDPSNPGTFKWVSEKNGSDLSNSEKLSLRHYRMHVNYDARVRDEDTQPSGLPEGGGQVFQGFTDWQELAP